MKLLLAAIVIALAFCSSSIAAFQVGLADPGAGRIPSAEVSALGLSLERRLVYWHGENKFSGSLSWTPGLRHFVAVFGGYPKPYVPRTSSERSNYCAFVVSILKRYPDVHDVIVWNEPNLAVFWGQGADAYVDLLAACSPSIRTAGARVWAPGLSPSTEAGVADYATRIAARGRHLIDGWDQHDYSDPRIVSMTNRIAIVRRAFGWKVPLLIGESGTQMGLSVPTLMQKAYCADAIGWLNFGKPRSYSGFAGALRAIRSGSANCNKPTPPPPPPQPRTAFRMRWGKSWICPERPDGSRVWKRSLCELDRVRVG